ncbi:hypothetical protein [Paraburkholderia dipogonis]|uniref:hypothetical protein n=1 Tax=Paraburkholderia dipogonis TaxID=1211383 RepID=UPI0038BA976B
MTAPNKLDVGAMMTDDDILRLVAQVLGNPLLFEDLKQDFTVHTEADDWIKFARVLLSASKPAAPEGWKLVPIKPTAQIVDAGGRARIDDFKLNDTTLTLKDAHRVAEAMYRAMIAASPAAPQPSPTAVVLDERAEFEAWWVREVPERYRADTLRVLKQSRELDGAYGIGKSQAAWEGWQARSVAQPVEQTWALTDDARDAARYRWLRQQHWNEADMFVVAGSKSQVRLGADCPSLVRLDDVIDAAIATAQSASGGNA